MQKLLLIANPAAGMRKVERMLPKLVNFFEEKYKSRTAAIIIVYVLAIAVIAGILLFLVPELVRSVKDLSRTIPVYFDRYQ